MLQTNNVKKLKRQFPDLFKTYINTTFNVHLKLFTPLMKWDHATASFVYVNTCNDMDSKVIDT